MKKGLVISRKERGLGDPTAWWFACEAAHSKCPKGCPICLTDRLTAVESWLPLRGFWFESDSFVASPRIP
jgi:hypothetical protein